MPPCASSSSTAGAGDSRSRGWAEPSDLEHPVEDQLEVLVAGLADPAAVLRHVAFLGGARDVAGLERHPAEFAVVVLGADPLRSVVREAKQLFAKPVLTLQAPIVLSDHVVFLHGTGTPALAGAHRPGGRRQAWRACVSWSLQPRGASFSARARSVWGRAGPGPCASLKLDGKDRRGPHSRGPPDPGRARGGAGLAGRLRGGGWGPTRRGHT